MNATEHRDLLLALFTEVTDVAVQLGLSPVGVSVRTYEVQVQIEGEDVAAVDAFADAYRLPPETHPYENYARRGDVNIAGHNIHLHVYTGRPRGVTA